MYPSESAAHTTHTAQAALLVYCGLYLQAPASLIFKENKCTVFFLVCMDMQHAEIGRAASCLPGNRRGLFRDHLPHMLVCDGGDAEAEDVGEAGVRSRLD